MFEQNYWVLDLVGKNDVNWKFTWGKESWENLEWGTLQKLIDWFSSTLSDYSITDWFYWINEMLACYKSTGYCDKVELKSLKIGIKLELKITLIGNAHQIISPFRYLEIGPKSWIWMSP